MKSFIAGSTILFLLCFYTFAQLESFTPSIDPPDFKAELSIGFNYDFLQSPLKVSFDYPKGYFGINIPLTYTPPASITGDLTESLSKQFNEGEEFEPEAFMRQNPNTTIRVDVPMMGGVATFSNMQMMHLKYMNTLGSPSLEINTTMQDEGGESETNLFLRGVVSVPIDFIVGWETMTFGYAYKVNDKLKFAFNLHRHIFSFDIKGKIDLDLLGYFSIQVDEEESGDYLSMRPEEINYSLHNTVDGHYEVERYSPTFAVKFWRASIISRFGMNTKPKGYLKAKYSVPFFIDPETFQINENMGDMEWLIDNKDRLLNSEVNHIEYSTEKDMTWKMPQAHTIMFDIIPEKLSLSYTKLFGNLEMKLYDPESDKSEIGYRDTLDFRFKALIDHMILFHVSFYHSFFNLGIYSMDFAFRDRKDLLSNTELFQNLHFGNGVIIPIINGGAMIGSKLQLLLEFDFLPLAALKTGVVYYF